MMQNRTFQLFGLICTMILLQGCETASYYGQAAKGQLSLLAARRDVQTVIESADTSPQLRTQLEKIQGILAFAAEQGLPVGDSYSQYVDLGRPYVVWNVFAAQRFSTQLKTHCFPIAGCVGYKGYFSQEAAEAYAAELKDQGLDVFVGGVSAYSTLGWFNDPLLNTFIYRSDERLAAVLFHELAHKVFYLKGDTVFNESYATAVERHLLRRWLITQNQPELFSEYLQSDQRRHEVIALILKTREELALIYGEGLTDSERLKKKAQTILAMKQAYASLQAEWAGNQEFAGWMAQDLNNAHLAAIGAYQSQVAGFTALLADRTLAEFLQEVEALGRLGKDERDERLEQAALAQQGDANQGNN